MKKWPQDVVRNEQMVNFVILRQHVHISLINSKNICFESPDGRKIDRECTETGLLYV